MVYWRFGGKGWVGELINYKGVYRTAPATPGLLKMVIEILYTWYGTANHTTYYIYSIHGVGPSTTYQGIILTVGQSNVN